MFDLGFFHLVSEILAWRVTPTVEFANQHKLAIARKRHTQSESEHRTTQLATLSTEERVLRAYIAITYASYFDIQLHTSLAVSHGIDKCYRE